MAWVLVWAYYVGVFVVGLLGGVVAAGLFGRVSSFDVWISLLSSQRSRMKTW